MKNKKLTQNKKTTKTATKITNKIISDKEKGKYNKRQKLTQNKKTAKEIKKENSSNTSLNKGNENEVHSSPNAEDNEYESCIR